MLCPTDGGNSHDYSNIQDFVSDWIVARLRVFYAVRTKVEAFGGPAILRTGYGGVQQLSLQCPTCGKVTKRMIAIAFLRAAHHVEKCASQEVLTDPASSNEGGLGCTFAMFCSVNRAP